MEGRQRKYRRLKLSTGEKVIPLACLAVGVSFLVLFVSSGILSLSSSPSPDDIDRAMRKLTYSLEITVGIVAIICFYIFSIFFRGRVRASKPKLLNAPGTHLAAIVDFLFCPATIDLTFKPLIADWRYEYFEALNQSRTNKARWINIRYRIAFACAFVMAMGLSKVFSLFKQISK